MKDKSWEAKYFNYSAQIRSHQLLLYALKGTYHESPIIWAKRRGENLPHADDMLGVLLCEGGEPPTHEGHITGEFYLPRSNGNQSLGRGRPRTIQGTLFFRGPAPPSLRGL